MNGIEFIVSQAGKAISRANGRDAMIAEMTKTMSQREIALELGVSRSLVHHVLRKMREGRI